MSDELRPCPFCGGEAEHFGGGGNHCVRCTVCEVTNETLKRGSMVFDAYRTADEAVAAWNARAAVTDDQFALAVHDGRTWQPARECRIEWRGQFAETDSGIECDGEYYCTACGDALPKWADGAWDDYQAARFEGEPPFRHCPECGAKVAG